jgi:hypothetical protein
VATTTVKNVHLAFEITYEGAPVVLDCQVIDAELTLPGTQPGETVEVACPDGKVSEPGTSVDGAITGNAFADPTDTGITWALAALYQAGDEFAYSITYWADQAETIAMKFSGSAKVNTFKLPFSKPGSARQPIDLKLITAVIARPAVIPLAAESERLGKAGTKAGAR